MYWLRFTLVLILASLLQAGGFSDAIALTSMNIKPDLLLILMVFFAINCDTYDAVIASFAIGFAADISGAAMGPFFLAFGILGSALAHFRQVILVERSMHQAIIIFIVGILAAGIAHYMTMFKVQSALPYSFGRLVAMALYSALLWFVVKWAVYGVGKWVGAAKKRGARKR